MRNLKSAPSGSSAKSKKPYYLNDSLQFLLPFVKTNAPDSDTQGNLPSPVAKEPETIESENESEDENHEVQNEIAVEDPDVTELTEPVARRGGTVQKAAKNKAKKRKSDVLDPDRAFVQFCESRKNRSEDVDSNKMFLLSLLSDVNQMNPQQTRRFKKQVMNLIDEILDEPLSVASSNANSGQSAILHTPSAASSSSINTCNVNSWTHGNSLCTTPFTSPTNTDVENQWPNHTSRTEWPNVWPLSNNSTTSDRPPNY